MSEKDSIKNNRGGARPGAGRPKGSTGKITAQALLEAADQIVGKPFVVSLLEGYRDTVLDGDRKTRVVYEKMLLDKVASNLLDVEVTDSDEVVATRAQAFAEALSKLNGITEEK